jgi:hypothetical protein
LTSDLRATRLPEQLRLRAERLHWRLVEGEVVALDVSRSIYLAVNATGAQLWEALARGATHDQLVALLRDTYGRDASDAERDVTAFVGQLAARDLLHGHEPDPSAAG